LPNGSADRAAGIVVSSIPQFSVMVPCYNQAHFLPAALDSLLAQTHPDWEALVVDDGSTDATSDVAQGYARRDARIRPFRKPNGGVASALNRALAEARGEWICWLSSDDLFLPDKLAVHRTAIQAEPSVRFMHTNYELLWDKTGQRRASGINVALFIPPPELQVLRLLKVNYFNGITVTLHRSVFQAVGGFNEEFRYGQDHDLWLRASAQFRSHFIDRATTVTRIHPHQGTALFTEAGIYDSGRAGAAFLNRHALPAIFPLLSLDRPEHALQAAMGAVAAALNPGSYVARGGFAPVLLDRVKEFLSMSSAPMRALVAQKLEQAYDSRTIAEVTDLIRFLRSAEAGGFRFAPYDPVALMQRQVARVEQRGDEKEAAALRRYLAMIADTSTRSLEAPRRDAVREAFLYETNWLEPAWQDVVRDFANTFAYGEPVALVLVFTAARAGQPLVDAAEALLRALLVRLGKQACADVILAGKPEGLLERLRAFDRVHWVPAADAPADARAGDAFARYLAARRRASAESLLALHTVSAGGSATAKSPPSEA
jgi:glycosyltransferase involved in cell wall biosynthesis